MKVGNVLRLAASVTLPLFICVGCLQGVKSDDQIWGQVTDLSSGAPLDSARIYETVLAGPLNIPGERRLRGFTDVDGRFRFWTSGADYHVVEAEKEGYLEGHPQMVKGGGEVNFVLAPAQ
jgi:hypothetical protein